jgi:hypothetical protein
MQVFSLTVQLIAAVMVPLYIVWRSRSQKPPSVDEEVEVSSFPPESGGSDSQVFDV